MGGCRKIMGKATPILNNFRSGELTPNMDARADLKIYNQGCQILQNALPLIEGGVMRMSGTRYVKPVKFEGMWGDHTYRHVYFGTEAGKILEVDLNDVSVESLTTSETNVLCADIYTTTGKALFVNPAGKVIFIDMNTLTEDGKVELEVDETSIESIIVDKDNGIAYVVDSVGKWVIKIDIPTMTRITGRLTVSGATGLGKYGNGAVDDTYLYFVSNASPPRCYRIRKSDFTNKGNINIFPFSTSQGATGHNLIEKDLNLLWFLAKNHG